MSTASASAPFVITRTLPFPVSRVWAAWSRSGIFEQWWGPAESTCKMCSFRFAPDGHFHYSMLSAGNPPLWGKGEILEILPQRKLTWINHFSDENGGITRAPGDDPWPLRLLSELTLQAGVNETTLTIRWTPLDPTPEEQAVFDRNHPSMQQGWSGSLDRLARVLAETPPCPSTSEGYVDGFLIPVAKDKLEDYRKLAETASEVWIDHGALDYRECIIEDPYPLGSPHPTFAESAQAGPDDTVVFAWILYPSREDRDRINAAVMKDPRLTCSMDPASIPFDCSKMNYAGFRTIVHRGL